MPMIVVMLFYIDSEMTSQATQFDLVMPRSLGIYQAQGEVEPNKKSEALL